MRSVAILLVAALALSLTPCLSQAAKTSCNDDNGGISVPAGFCARVFAKDVGALRHLTVSSDGTVYAVLSSPSSSSGRASGGIAVLKDTDDDGQANAVRYFGDVTGTGIRLHGGYLYVGENEAVVRFRLDKQGMPEGSPEPVAGGFPVQREHTAKSIAFDDGGHLYVNVGAPSNACQRQDRVRHSPGIDPCPLLAEHGGIWRFAADKTGQKFAANARFATGIRNAVAIAWNAESDSLWAVMMGRDQLHDNWPEEFTVVQSAELPAEELLRVRAGADYGWPYCYYDGERHELVLAPEYGGDGVRVGRCKRYAGPVAAFPAHWAPEAMVFYRGKAFPARYRGGAFIAFHGSWNRAPLPQQGFVVGFVPMKAGKLSGSWKVFAKGFAGAKIVKTPKEARFRPVGIAEGPNGALYVADSQHGWIWRITWQGKR